MVLLSVAPEGASPVSLSEMQILRPQMSLNQIRSLEGIAQPPVLKQAPQVISMLAKVCSGTVVPVIIARGVLKSQV